jgi:hypothetical protein
VRRVLRSVSNCLDSLAWRNAGIKADGHDNLCCEAGSAGTTRIS